MYGFTHWQNTIEVMLRLADARYRAVLACSASWSGLPCADIGDFASSGLDGCALMVPTGAEGTAAKRGALLLAPSFTATSASTSTVFSNECCSKLQEFLGSSGCCAATAAAAQAEWFSAVSGNPVLGKHFRVQWSVDNHIEEISTPNSCPVISGTGLGSATPYLRA
jgi:hypothetical protein